MQFGVVSASTIRQREILEAKQVVRVALSMLRENQAKVIGIRYGIDPPQKMCYSSPFGVVQRVIAEQMGFSTGRASEIERHASGRLRYCISQDLRKEFGEFLIPYFDWDKRPKPKWEIEACGCGHLKGKHAEKNGLKNKVGCGVLVKTCDRHDARYVFCSCRNVWRSPPKTRPLFYEPFSP